MSDSPTKHDHDAAAQANLDPNPPTVAAFSPANLSHTSTKRSTILVHQKSPLLLATPPQITRALAYSHPFLLPLNKVVGLLTWTTGDPWESFLLLASFWMVTLYGDVVMRWTGPMVVVVGLILGMYARRYSPLSSTGRAAGSTAKPGHSRVDSEATNTKHQKTLDEIVETLRTFTARCNILLDPLLELTDFLSTQRTATTATTRPALTTLLLRILLLTPIWYGLTLRPIMIITTKRCAIVTGTIFITWHSRPNRVARAILWRSSFVRRFCSAMTGLHLTDSLVPPTSKSAAAPPLPPRPGGSSYLEALQAVVKRRPSTPGVKFTFILYENQRRWVGLGWTTSLFAYERALWTDEHLNAVPAKEEFELPDVDEQNVRWRWVPGSQWLVEGAGEFEEGGSKAKDEATDGGQGWIYYDNKWQNGRRGQDGWGRYTRRRKWYRDAELIEITPNTISSPPQSATPTPNSGSPTKAPSIKAQAQAHDENFKSPPDDYVASIRNEAISTKTSSFSSSYKSRTSMGSASGNSTSGFGGRRKRGSRASSIASDEDARDRLAGTGIRESESAWGIGDDLRMGLE